MNHRMLSDPSLWMTVLASAPITATAFLPQFSTIHQRMSDGTNLSFMIFIGLGSVIAGLIFGRVSTIAGSLEKLAACCFLLAGAAVSLLLIWSDQQGGAAAWWVAGFAAGFSASLFRPVILNLMIDRTPRPGAVAVVSRMRLRLNLASASCSGLAALIGFFLSVHHVPLWIALAACAVGTWLFAGASRFPGAVQGDGVESLPGPAPDTPSGYHRVLHTWRQGPTVYALLFLGGLVHFQYFSGFLVVVDRRLAPIPEYFGATVMSMSWVVVTLGQWVLLRWATDSHARNLVSAGLVFFAAAATTAGFDMPLGLLGAVILWSLGEVLFFTSIFGLLPRSETSQKVGTHALGMYQGLIALSILVSPALSTFAGRRLTWSQYQAGLFILIAISLILATFLQVKKQGGNS